MKFKSILLNLKMLNNKNVCKFESGVKPFSELKIVPIAAEMHAFPQQTFTRIPFTRLH